MRKRTWLEILALLLGAAKGLHEEGLSEVPLSRVAAKIFVSYDRFQRYWAVAVETGLVDSSGLVTEKGERYLRSWTDVEELLGDALHG